MRKVNCAREKNPSINWAYTYPNKCDPWWLWHLMSVSFCWPWDKPRLGSVMCTKCGEQEEESVLKWIPRFWGTCKYESIVNDFLCGFNVLHPLWISQGHRRGTQGGVAGDLQGGTWLSLYTARDLSDWLQFLNSHSIIETHGKESHPGFVKRKKKKKWDFYKALGKINTLTWKSWSQRSLW